MAASSPVALLCGSRSLSPAFAPAVAAVARSLAAAGRQLAVGCSAGADSFGLSAAAAGGLPVAAFAVGSSSGAGFGPCSCPLSLLSSLPAGSVRWLAGGPLSVPFAARLARRSLAAVAFAAAGAPGSGLVCFGLSPSSRGSLLACRAAVAAGLPVCVFPAGAPLPLPALGCGAWAPAGRGLWAGAFRWAPAGRQLSLF